MAKTILNKSIFQWKVVYRGHPYSTALPTVLHGPYYGACVLSKGVICNIIMNNKYVLRLIKVMAKTWSACYMIPLTYFTFLIRHFRHLRNFWKMLKMFIFLTFKLTFTSFTGFWSALNCQKQYCWNIIKLQKL